MSTGEASPYAATYNPTIESDQRPGGLTTIGVLCIVGGIVGILSGLFMLLNIFFGAALGSAFTMQGPQQQAQQEMQSSMQAVATRFFVGNLISSVGTLVVSLCMLTGGVGVFRKPAWGRTLLRKTFLFAILLECLRVGIYTMTQLEMMPVMETYMQKMMTQPGGGNPPMAVGGMMKVMTLIGLGMWLMWAALKLGLYIWGCSYLKKPSVINYFGVVPLTKD